MANGSGANKDESSFVDSLFSAGDLIPNESTDPSEEGDTGEEFLFARSASPALPSVETAAPERDKSGTEQSRIQSRFSNWFRADGEEGKSASQERPSVDSFVSVLTTLVTTGLEGLGAPKGSNSGFLEGDDRDGLDKEVEWRKRPPGNTWKLDKEKIEEMKNKRKNKENGADEAQFESTDKPAYPIPSKEKESRKIDKDSKDKHNKKKKKKLPPPPGKLVN